MKEELFQYVLRYKEYCQVAVLFILLYFLLGFYHRELTELYFHATFEGVFLSQPTALFNNWGCHTFTSYLFKFLYQLNNKVPWYGIIMSMYIYISVVNFLKILNRVFDQLHLTGHLIALLFTIAMVMLLIENIVLFQFTIAAFLICSTAIFLLIDEVWRSSAITKQSTSKKLWLNFLIVIAILTRIEAATSVIVLVLLTTGLIKPNVRQYAKVLRALMPAIIIAIFGWFMYFSAFNEADRGLRNLRPYQYTLWDFGQEKQGLRLETRKDSVIYKAASMFFFNDPKNINGDFFKKINIRPKERSIFQIRNYLENTPFIKYKADLMFLKIKEHYLHYLLSYIVLVVLCTVAIFHFNWKVIGRFLIIQLLLVTVTLMVSIFMKVEGRVFITLIMLGLIINLFFMAYNHSLNPQNKIRNFLLTVVAFGLLIVSIFKLIDLSKEIQQRKIIRDQVRAIKAEINLNFKNKIVVYDLLSARFLYADLFDSFDRSAGIIPLSLDNGLMFLNDSYKKYMRDICGTAEFIEVISCLKEKKDKVVLVYSDQKIDLLDTYLSAVYNETLNTHTIYNQSHLSEPMDYIAFSTAKFRYRVIN